MRLALKNIKRVYGEPQLAKCGGMTDIYCESRDFNSSFFLDYDFWNSIEKKYPEGIVAAVPNRYCLGFTPLSDDDTVNILKRDAKKLFKQSEEIRISSALYLFKNGHWSVF